MKIFTLRTKIYLWTIILCGTILLGWNLLHVDISNLGLILILSTLASVSLISKVEGTTSLSHYNISFFFYAYSLVLLGPSATMIVILISNIVEWVWHKYPWYIQIVNLGMYFITTQAMSLAYGWINPTRDLTNTSSILAIIVSVAVFTLLNHLIIGLVVWLARGEDFAKSGILDFLPIVIDYTLLAMGATGALLWNLSPYAVVLALLPLYLIYGTLKVPGLERKTEIDSKTGLFNYQYFKRALQTELDRANRFDRPLTVVMADLDLLRNINNTYGHLAGDEVLIGVANILKTSFRDVDTVTRFGGEEFAILIPETTPEEIYAHIDEIRHRIQMTPFRVETSISPIHATLSFGISGRSNNQISYTEIINNADSALYFAKLNGRNRIKIYTEEVYLGLFQQAINHNDSGSTVEYNETLKPPAENAYIKHPPKTDNSEPQELKKKPIDKSKKKISHASLWLNSFIIFLVAACVFLYVIIQTFSSSHTDWMGMAIFTGILALAEWFSVDIYSRDTSISTSTAFMLAGTLLFGPLCSLIMSLIFALIAKVKHNSKWNRVIFNFSNQLLACLFCIGIIKLNHHSFIELSWLEQALLSMISATIFYFSTTLAITIAMHFDAGLPVKATWNEKFSWLLPYYLVLGLVGLILMLAYEKVGIINAVTIFISLFLLRYSQKQYIDRTREMVSELKKQNTILEKNSMEISLLNDGLLNALAYVIDLRDPNMLGHSQQVTKYAIKLAARMGLPKEQIDTIRNASLLHDIGKLGIPEEILGKPDSLSADERAFIQNHVLLGAGILAASNALVPLIPVVRHHHERFDGKGYPDQLSGNDIPLEARIVAIADAVDSMASDRPYRKALNCELIINELINGKGTQFDPDLAGLMIDLIEELDGHLLINSASSPLKISHVKQSIHPMRKQFEPVFIQTH